MKNGRYYSNNSVADVVLAESYKPVFRRLINNNPNDLRAIYNPLMFQESNNAKETIKENIILFVGRLSAQKNLKTLLKIWASIRFKDDWVLEIVGDGDYKEILVEETRKLGLKDSVIFRGPTDTPEEYYKRSKIFAMTSTFEGFPMTLLECQKYGCIPIVFNSYAAAGEIIHDNYNGYLISNNNEKEFEKKMLELMRCSEFEMEMLRENCKQEVLKYNLNSIMSSWMDLINKYAIYC